MNQINPIDPAAVSRFPALEIRSPHLADDSGGMSFSDFLAESLRKVDELGTEAERLQVNLALGRPVELHQVMLAATKAQLAMELFIELRNKLIEAYQEISRMPV